MLGILIQSFSSSNVYGKSKQIQLWEKMSWSRTQGKQKILASCDTNKYTGFKRYFSFIDILGIFITKAVSNRNIYLKKQLL